MSDNNSQKMRTCLSCSKLFNSTHAGNRICPKCTKNSRSNSKTTRLLKEIYTLDPNQRG